MKILVLACLAACFFGVSSLRADTVTLTPLKDNTLFSDPNGGTSNGSGDAVFAGRVGAMGGGWLQRAVLAFDIASNVPHGSTITSITFTLNLITTVSGNQTITMHRLLADWGEGASSGFSGLGAPAQPGDATWLYRFFPGSPWSTPGGDYIATASASKIVGSALIPYTWTSTPALVADVQAWVNDPTTNFGWLIHGNEAVLKSSKKFASREFSDPAKWPSLVVQFTPPLPCPADIAPTGGNSAVNVDDLLAVINSWGPCPAPPANCPADIAPSLGGNGMVNVDDLLTVINSWGPCP